MAFPFLVVLRWARQLISLLPFPNWTNVEETRVWVLEALMLAEEAADETSTQVDDVLVEAFRKIVMDVEIWPVVYGLILDLIGVVGSERVDLISSDGTRAIADKAGIDFAIFQKLLAKILEFIEWFQELKL